MIEVEVYSYHGDIPSKAKKLYSKEACFEWVCPECNSLNVDMFDQTPLIVNYAKGSEYCHNYVCDVCSFESEEKMYKFEGFGDDSVFITPSEDFQLKVSKQTLMLVPYEELEVKEVTDAK